MWGGGGGGGGEGVGGGGGVGGDDGYIKSMLKRFRGGGENGELGGMGLLG
jgi:hypothetical protein